MGVKTDQAWDNQWKNADEFITWIGLLCKQYHRILRPNGSLYMYASEAMAARVELEISKWFNVLNRIVWRKHDGTGYDTGAHSKINEASLRSYFPRTEYILFAEHYGADNAAKGVPGYASELNRLRGFVFEPIRAYLAGERDRAGLTNGQVEELLGTYMARHYFGHSQWELPTAYWYGRLREIFNEHGRPPQANFELYHPADGLWTKYHANGADPAYLAPTYAYLGADYSYLSIEFERLRADYEALRRPFYATEADYTDVWDHGTVAAFAGKHPCEKPLDQIEQIVRISSRPGDVVLDSFMGSGVVGAAARKLGRRFIGIEADPHWFVMSRARIGDASALLDLPKVSGQQVFTKRGNVTRAPAAQLSLFDMS
jgi:site-specific DNA-methyltransferase (adenine-specific)